jgi:bile acid:Na+ symporter, BASS family
LFRLKDIILLLVIYSSMLTGIILPRAFTCLQPYPFYLMMLLLFLSLLPIKTKTVWRTVRDSFKTIFTLTLFKLIILPAAVYVLFHIFCPPYAVASLLLTGISTGVVAPFNSNLLRANSSLVLVMVVVSSILAPFTLPILVKLFLAKSVGISLFAMIRMLCLVIFVPFVAVQMIRRLSPGLNLLIMKRQFPLSLVAFALINLGVFPQYADLFRRNPATILDATLVACILSGIYVLSGMIFYQRRSLETRLAAAVSLGNMNNVLIIVFSSHFFGPLEPTLAAMYMIPFFGLILPLRFYSRLKGNR